MGRSGDAWPLAVGAGFLVVYARALAFRFIEGDDAASIAFHALGRRSEVQTPYSIYHAGTDLLLSVLPSNEPVLRFSAIGLGAVAAMVMVWQMLALVYSWVAASSGTGRWEGDESERFKRARPLLAFFLLLAMPELFFLGLVYTPAVIGLALVLSAHRMLRFGWRSGRGNGIGPACAAGLLFGMGGACRFDLILYGGIILMDLVLLDRVVLDWALFGRALPKGRLSKGGLSDRGVQVRRRLMAVVAFSLVAALTWWSVLFLAGYRFSDLASVLRLAQSVAGDDEGLLRYAMRFGASSQTLYTPALTALFALGLVRQRGRQRWFTLVNGAGLLFAVFILRWPVPKTHLIFLPGLLLAVCVGWLAVWCPSTGRSPVGEGSGKHLLLRRVALVLLLALPWLVGARVSFPDTSWGSGYVLRLANQPPRLGSGLSLQSGTAIPTPEGPRPLWGFLWTLLGGDQRRMTLARDDGRRVAIARSLEQDLPIVILQGAPGLVQAELARQGLGTNDPPGIGAGRIEGPRWFGPAMAQGGCSPCDTVAVFKLRGSVSSWIGSQTDLAATAERLGATRAVIVGYPGNLREVWSTRPVALELLGPASGILDLGRAVETADRSTSRD